MSEFMKKTDGETGKLKIAVALLVGVVIGMLISPRKKVRYTIGSYNSANGTKPGGSDDEDYYDGEDDGFDEDSFPGENAIRL